MHLLWNGPPRAALTVVLAHGAGAPMDTPFMTFFAAGIAAAGYRVARFEFPYMAARRGDGRKRPPDRAPVLLQAWRDAIVKIDGPVVIGGKSMGGRIASLIAADRPPPRVRGLLCLGYPFYGAGRRDKPRIAHLAGIAVPTLICQGTRDPLGDRATVAALALRDPIRLCWIEDGDHDLKPRRRSSRSAEDAWGEALDAIGAFLSGLR
jgi:predicted alpha/beta-hydrolase family hydrolase